MSAALPALLLCVVLVGSMSSDALAQQQPPATAERTHHRGRRLGQRIRAHPSR
jgi:hypothetical protein